MVLTGTSSKHLERLVNLCRSVPIAQHRPAIEHVVRQRRLSPEEITKIIISYRDGATPAELARRFGLHRHSVRQVLERAAIPLRSRHVPSEDQIAEAVQLYGNGWSLQRIGNKLGFGAETIRQHIRRRGVARRHPWDHPDAAATAEPQ